MSAERRSAEGPLDEPVTLRPYDPGWPERFARERRRIEAALGAEAGGIEHIGSTAVPGLAAKPVVDVLVGVGGPLAGHPVVGRIVALGYECLGEAGVPGRLYFRRRLVGDAFNVHVVEHESGLWRDNLALRDFLRSDPEAAAAYAQAKARAAAAAPESLLRYSDLKAGAVAELLRRARAHPR